MTAPQCTPSRAGVITGVYQNRFGVEHNNLAMKQEVVTLPERLKQAGYVTGISGKFEQLEDTIRSFKAVVEGEYDHLPESAFYMVGGIDEAVAKAEKMAAEA